MGYTESEARLGLRAANGNLENAIQRIIDDKEVLACGVTICVQNYNVNPA